MKDTKARLEKLLADAAECALIRDLAADPQKRELFTRLPEHLATLASEEGGDCRQTQRRKVMLS